MSPKTSKFSTTSGTRHRSGGWREAMTPGRIVVLVLAALALVFIFENTQDTEIRLLIPVVTMPLWAALLATGLIGALCGAYFVGRRR
ncbi:LapA family protein [Streptomyces sp. NPDC000345]|uniref:LapA family protein n=1 Tax=Streptomyces sp. NPDC000345 TaxID=3364537 RepID=UPI003698E23C